MMAIKILIKSSLGLLLGSIAGALMGALSGAVLVGPEWLIGGMALGTMAGSVLGTSTGFLKSLDSRQPVPRRRMARNARQPAWARLDATVSGD